MIDHWTPETEVLVAAMVHRAECMGGRECPSFAKPSYHDRTTARDVLTALDGAGLLVPPGGRVFVTADEEGDQW